MTFNTPDITHITYSSPFEEYMTQRISVEKEPKDNECLISLSLPPLCVYFRIPAIRDY